MVHFMLIISLFILSDMIAHLNRPCISVDLLQLAVFPLTEFADE